MPVSRNRYRSCLESSLPTDVLPAATGPSMAIIAGLGTIMPRRCNMESQHRLCGSESLALGYSQYILTLPHCIGMTLFSNVTLKHVGILLALSITGAICYLAATYETFPGDMGALERFQTFRSPGLDTAALTSTAIGSFWVAIGSIVVLSAILWLARMRADALTVLLVLIPEGLNLALKEIVGRPRPEELFLLIAAPGNLSFPSGHAVHAFLLLGLLILIMGKVMQALWLRRSIQGLLVFSILACGASRVYLGVHWPSDVLGGYLVGGFSMWALLWIRKKLLNRGLH